MNALEVISKINGEKFNVDISSEACEPCGFHHGDHFIDHKCQKCMVVGIARAAEWMDSGPPVLWATLSEDKDTNLVVFYFLDELHKLQFIRP